jgi:hypothetical protein
MARGVLPAPQWPHSRDRHASRSDDRGGLELAAACHIRVADETAFFALPEGTRGIYVDGGASVHVARLLGASRGGNGDRSDIDGFSKSAPRRRSRRPVPIEVLKCRAGTLRSRTRSYLTFPQRVFSCPQRRVFSQRVFPRISSFWLGGGVDLRLGRVCESSLQREPNSFLLGVGTKPEFVSL